MRAIMRFSADADPDGQFSDRLRAILEKPGFALNPRVTATYEHDAITEQQLAQTMSSFWQLAVNPPGKARVDHVWMYCDNPPDFPLPDFSIGDET